MPDVLVPREHGVRARGCNVLPAAGALAVDVRSRSAAGDDRIRKPAEYAAGTVIGQCHASRRRAEPLRGGESCAPQPVSPPKVVARTPRRLRATGRMGCSGRTRRSMTTSASRERGRDGGRAGRRSRSSGQPQVGPGRAGLKTAVEGGEGYSTWTHSERTVKLMRARMISRAVVATLRRSALLRRFPSDARPLTAEQQQEDLDMHRVISGHGRAFGPYARRCTTVTAVLLTSIPLVLTAAPA